MDLDHFATFGFVLLRGALDPAPLRAELDQALHDGAAAPITVQTGAGHASVQYVPMMCQRTPVSLALLDRFQADAAALVGDPVLPIRAKGMRYNGDTPWHADSLREVRSVGFAAYLEPLTEDTGALRVLPGSHRGDLRDAVLARLAALGTGVPAGALPGFAVATQSGDVIAFDERLLHASAGGPARRQWRIDYVRDPQTPAEEASVRAYLAGIFPPDWRCGYDVDRFPSYGEAWLESGRPAVERLRALGAYDLAAAQERFARTQRPTPVEAG